MSSFRPHKFGRFVIVDPIAVGGMAEIYRARYADTEENGPDRIIIIKKVIANFSQDNEFVKMFEEEIKITVGLSHPNIVQIYDYGRVNGQSFLAMEYVEGKNLRQFLKALFKNKSMFSIDMSCHIVSQVCHALGYAHSFKDRMSGKHLGIVHRDISPQNVMVSYDGAIKLFDFGIAKAKSAGESTRAGVIKGKPSYLSPEQIAGEKLDGRSDIFALGIMLWEMLTAKRLFVADNDLAILQMIQSKKIEPPSKLNPAVPPELDQIVFKSLERNRDKRYSTAEDFQRDLHRFLYSFNSNFNPADLSYYAKELFKEEIEADRNRLMEALSIKPIMTEESSASAESKNEAVEKADEKTGLAEGIMSSSELSVNVQEELSKQIDTQIDKTMEVDIGTKEEEASKTDVGQGQAKTSPPSPKKKPALPNSSAAPKTTEAKASTNTKSPAKKPAPWSKPEQTKTRTGVALRREKSRTASQSRDALSKELSRSASPMPALKTVAAILVVAGISVFAIFKTKPELLQNTFLAAFLAAPESSVASNDVDAAEDEVAEYEEVQDDGVATTDAEENLDEGVDPSRDIANMRGDLFFKLSLADNKPSDSSTFTIKMDNSLVILSNGKLKLPLNAPALIHISKEGYVSQEFRVTLTAEQPQQELRVALAPEQKGTLNFSTNPGADITLYREGAEPEIGFTPFNKEVIAGDYRVLVENKLMNYKQTFQIKVLPNKQTEYHVELTTK